MNVVMNYWAPHSTCETVGKGFYSETFRGPGWIEPGIQANTLLL